MDTIVGRNHQSVILTITDRYTNMIWISRPLKGGGYAELIAQEAIRILSPYKHWIKTITTDNGSEFAQHELISKHLGVPIYFTDPYSPWQKGAVEHANKLIRQYLPKQTDFTNYSYNDLMKIQERLNHRPRKKLNFFTPYELFYQKLS